MRNKRSSGVATDLVGMFVRKHPDVPHVWDGVGGSVSGQFPGGAESARVVAVWTEKQQPSGEVVLKVAVVAPSGVVGEFYLTHVLLDPDAKR